MDASLGAKCPSMSLEASPCWQPEAAALRTCPQNSQGPTCPAAQRRGHEGGVRPDAAQASGTHPERSHHASSPCPEPDGCPQAVAVRRSHSALRVAPSQAESLDFALRIRPAAPGLGASSRALKAAPSLGLKDGVSDSSALFPTRPKLCFPSLPILPPSMVGIFSFINYLLIIPAAWSWAAAWN